MGKEFEKEDRRTCRHKKYKKKERRYERNNFQTKPE
jgi:hypothetical protein